jgi:hypothetical protein
VGLHPERLVLERSGRALARRPKTREVLPVAAGEASVPRWRAAVDRLASLGPGALANGDVTVVLSGLFVRSTLVPWSDALTSEEELQAFARHCFARIYGAQGEGWVVTLSDSGAGEHRVACAVERSLVEALAAVVTGAQGRLRSVQPHPMASFNRCRPALGAADAWFVDVEPGLASIALLQEQQWQSLRTVKVGPAWRHDLPGLLSREACLVECATQCTRVAVFAEDDDDTAPVQAGGWTIAPLPALEA